RRKYEPCVRIMARAPARRLAAKAESLGEERTAMPQALLVDAVTDPGRDVPLDRNFERSEVLRALKQRLDRDQVVLVAVDQQHRRLALNLTCYGIGLGAVRQHEDAGIADDGGGWHSAAQADMQRHHGALAEADQGQRLRRQLSLRQFVVEKLVQR